MNFALIRFSLCFAVLLPWFFLTAAEPTPVLILRIEAGMHTSLIKSVSTDAAGRVVLTVSDDKTARLWSLELPAPSSARPDTDPVLQPVRSTLLQTFRIPIGGGQQGQLVAGALSPDGSLAAVGGITGEGGKPVTENIYIFDTATGRIVRVLGGLPSAVFKLAYSPSGKALAAVMSQKGRGLLIFDPATGQRLAADAAYGDGSCDVEWHGDSRLVTTCLDGKVRLYDVARLFTDSSSGSTIPLNPLAKADTKSPFAARFSPDGTRLAVGFVESPTVAVFAVPSMKLVGEPDIKGIRNGSQSAIAWSTDGDTLAGGGTSHNAKGEYLVRIWSHSGSGPFHDVPVAQNSILELCPFARDGYSGFLYAAGDPAWGVVHLKSPLSNHTSNEPIRLGSSPNADYRDNLEGFRLSDDGSAVAFGYQWRGKTPASFSLTDRQLRLGQTSSHPPTKTPKTAQAKTLFHSPRVDGLPITDWKYTNVPKLRGEPLKNLSKYEQSISLAIASDASFFVHGTETRLSCYSKNGMVRWQRDAPGVWALNLSTDGRLAAAAGSDGTIRWHRADNGKELLAFFPHADGKRWILWTQLLDSVELDTSDASRFSSDFNSAILGAGFQRGRDMVMSINGTRIGPKDLLGPMAQKAFDGSKPGDSVQIGLRVNGRERRTNVPVMAKRQDVVYGTYYDCSPGGEDLIGWHMNRSKDQAADFFPVARFRAIYYRPDVIQRVLKTLDVSKALLQANAVLGKPESKGEGIAAVIQRLSPPVVELESGGVFREVELPDTATSVKLRYRIRNTGKTPAAKVEVRLNGRPLLAMAPLPAGDEAAEVEVPLPAGVEGTLAVIASHDLASSEAASVRLKRTGPPANARKPDLYVIAAGVSKLQANIGLDTNGDGKVSDEEFLKKFSKDGIILDDLHGAAADAPVVGALFDKEQGRTFGKVTSSVMVNEQATTAAVRAAINQVAAQARSGDVVVFSFSGHGYADETHEFFLATHDMHPDRAVATALTGSELAKLLAPIKARVVLSLDTCQAGAVLGRQEGQKVITGPGDLTGLVNTLSSSEQGIVVLSSSSESELSFESGGGGYFTRALVEGLQGQASRNGVVTCVSLQDYITRRVPELLNQNSAIKAQGLTQTPTFIMPKGAPDFVLATPP